MFRRILALGMSVAAGCTDLPAEDVPHGEPSEEHEGFVDETGCAVTWEPVAADEVPVGFELSPDEVLALTTGEFTGDFERDGPRTATISVVAVGEPLLARAASDGCEDHYQVALTWTLDAGDLLAFTVDTELAYYDHEEVLDEVTDSDTAFLGATTLEWLGTAAPVGEADGPFALQLFGYWADDAWGVDLSFLADGAEEESFAVFDATRAEAP